jgi:hypothetical protein
MLAAMPEPDMAVDGKRHTMTPPRGRGRTLDYSIGVTDASNAGRGRAC